MPTCALKSPKRTRDSDEVAFPNATSTSSRKALYCDSILGAYTCKIHRDRSCSLSFRRQTLPPSGTQSTTLSQHQLEQTLLHQHLSILFFIMGIFILLSRESDQCAIRARLGVAGHLSTTPRWGNPVKCFSQRHNK